MGSATVTEFLYSKLQMTAKLGAHIHAVIKVEQGKQELTKH